METTQFECDFSANNLFESISYPITKYLLLY